MVFLFGAPVHWTSKRQSVVAKSSTEADCIAVNTAIEDGLMDQTIVSEVLLAKLSSMLTIGSLPAI